MREQFNIKIEVFFTHHCGKSDQTLFVHIDLHWVYTVKSCAHDAFLLSKDHLLQIHLWAIIKEHLLVGLLSSLRQDIFKKLNFEKISKERLELQS
jgi:hypothetical protein